MPFFVSRVLSFPPHLLGTASGVFPGQDFLVERWLLDRVSIVIIRVLLACITVAIDYSKLNSLPLSFS